MELFSPAKINLFLSILRRRPDGYHELCSLVQAIDQGDWLFFDWASTDQLTCTDPQLPCDATNLVLRALELFRRKTGRRFSLKIHLKKQIPLQAGLGGGSSNAATTLFALNALHHFLVPEEQLQEWSKELGSDVPFFFSLGTGYCSGRGEEVRALEELPLTESFRFMLLKPQEGLSTPKVYQEMTLEECSLCSPEKRLHQFYGGKPEYHNDLEKAALRLSPQLAALKKSSLEKYKGPIFMTGSGSALVVVGEGNQRFLRRRPGCWYPPSMS